MYECWCEKQTDERVEKTSETIASCVYQGHAAGVQRVAVFFFRRRTSVIGSQNFHKKRRSFNPRYGPIPFLSFWRVRAWKQAWRTWETSTHSRLITGKQKQQKTIRWSRQKRTSNAKNIFLSLFFVVLLRMEMQALITSTEKVTTKKRMGRAFSRKTLVGKGRN